MEIFLNIFTSDFWFASIRSTTPILFGTLAAVVASRAGVINLSIEGTMLSAAFTGVVFSAFFQNPWMGLLAAIAVGMLLSGLLGYFGFVMKANMLITGIAINIMSSGGTVFLLYALTGDKGTSTSLKSVNLPIINIPFIQDIPFIGAIISGHYILTYVAIFCIIFLHVLFNKTAMGIRIKAVGESPESAASVGINVMKTKYVALLLSGALAAMGGAYLSMGYVSWFSAGMTAGRGYIALAARAIAGNTSLGSLLASFMFGTAYTLSNYLQGLSIPVEVIQMFPYIITILGFIIISIITTKKEAKRKRALNN